MLFLAKDYALLFARLHVVVHRNHFVAFGSLKRRLSRLEAHQRRELLVSTALAGSEVLVFVVVQALIGVQI